MDDFLQQMMQSIGQQIDEQRQQMMGAQAQAAGMPPTPPGQIPAASPQEITAWLQQMGYRPDMWLQLDDQVKSRWIQRCVDNQWNKAGLDDWLWRTLLRKGARGWQFPMFGFNDRTKLPLMTNLSCWQVYPDPQFETLDRMNYIVADLFADEGEAYTFLPQTCWAAIEEFAHPGIAQVLPNATLMGSPNQQTFYRRMVEITIFHARNETMPMPPLMAIAQGKVTAGQMPLDPEAAAAAALQQMHPEANTNDSMRAPHPQSLRLLPAWEEEMNFERTLVMVNRLYHQKRRGWQPQMRLVNHQMFPHARPSFMPRRARRFSPAAITGRTTRASAG